MKKILLAVIATALVGCSTVDLNTIRSQIKPVINSEGKLVLAVPAEYIAIYNTVKETKEAGGKNIEIVPASSTLGD